MRGDHSLTSKSQHCVPVLLVVCDSLAVGPSFRHRPMWQKSTRTLAHHHHLGLMKTTQRRGHPLRVGHWHCPLPIYSTLQGPSACRQEPCACEDASWLMCFHLGKERWEVAGRRSTFGSCWVEHGNCQQLPALSHITPPCCVPPTGCTEELIGLGAASHAQNCHHCVATWLPPSPSKAVISIVCYSP